MTVAHVTLATRDVRRTQEFFTATLGWRAIDGPGNVPVPAAWLEVAPGKELHLVEVAGFCPSPFEHEFGRHVAVRFPTSGLAALKKRLEAHGAELVEPQRESTVERFFFRDWNGYVFEVIGA